MQAHRQASDRPQRLVLDTNVWLDLLCFDDPRLASLRALATGAGVLLLTDPRTRAEWQRVLAYPQLSLDAAARQALIDAYDALSCPLAGEDMDRRAPAGVALPRCRDRDDQIFVELAAVGAASALLTRDKALLALDRRCQRVAGFAVCQPLAWLAGFVAEDLSAGAA